MATGKSVNLRVRPYVSVDLAFPVDGVIHSQGHMPLGKKVQGLSVQNLYQMLGQTVEDDPSRLLWDSQQIFSYLHTGEAPGAGATILSRLRNVSEAADLDRAVMMRQNAYLTSYSPTVLGEVERVYYQDLLDNSAVRHQLLKEVEDDIGRIHQGLTNVYKKRGWLGKVIEYARSKSDNTATQESPVQTIEFEGVTDTKSWGYEFRYPSAENDLRYHQARAAVRQEFLNAWRMSEMCRHGNTTFANELGAIDLSIRKLQSAYIDTFLTMPTFGIVTGVFHVEGDYVRAGEPVLRVESDEKIYLVGTVKYRGMLRIGSKLEVSTTLFEAAGAAPTTVSGEVVAVRGHDSVSEQWDLLILCVNRIPGEYEPILPLNYNFDFESTTVEVITP
ncbi:MAG: hypothetical protein ACXW5U_11455 [Thermoanaerobaculia bacterium]